MYGCQSDSKEDQSAYAPKEQPTYTNEQGTLISNGIALEATGVKVRRAFLLYDNSTPVPPGNTTSPGRTVRLRLVVDSGWRKEDGQVSLGASEIIRTDKDQVVLDEKDLFAASPSLDARAAQEITLTVTLSKLGRGQRHFVVSFRVWDKKGSGEIKGSYKLLVQ